MLGDLISGNIHITTRLGNTEDVTTISILKYKKDQLHADNEFTFDVSKYPGCEVIDLR